MGKSSRKMEFEAHKVIVPAGIAGQPSAADVLPVPLLVCKASGTCVVPEKMQRISR
jgi:3-aminobutyryl-CoA ammonia-lyase